MTWSRRLTAAIAGAVALIGCGVDVAVVSTGASRTAGQAAGAPDTADRVTTDTTNTTQPPQDPVTTPAGTAVVEAELYADIDLASVAELDGDKPDRAHDAFVAVAFTDIERWWASVYPEVYGASFEPLAGGLHTDARASHAPPPSR